MLALFFRSEAIRPKSFVEDIGSGGQIKDFCQVFRVADSLSSCYPSVLCKGLSLGT
jgi:hypothetical protein